MRGPKQDGDAELVNLADRASRPHAPLPLPLFSGLPDRPEHAATIAVVEKHGTEGT